MKKIKFLAKSLLQYKGLDGNGGILDMKQDDTAEVSDHVAKLLKQYYTSDFEIIAGKNPDHMPKSDKALKKTAQFKSK